MNYSDLDNAIGGDTSYSLHEPIPSDRTIDVTANDPIEMLTNRMVQITTENTELKKRVKALEDKMQSILVALNVERNKGTISVPYKDYFHETPTAVQRKQLSNDRSIVEVDESMSVVSAETESTRRNMFMNSSTFSLGSMSGSMRPMTATAAMGYNNKKSIWGTALASMLIAMIRYYVTKTGGKNIMLDETQTMKVCTYLAPVLYEMSTKDLPSVKTPTSKYMSSAISRITSHDVPQSTAEAWYEMTKTQDGRDCITVIETMINHGKKMPEVLGHPLSNILPYIRTPVVRVLNGISIFSISGKIKFNERPGQWDIWCSLLKSAALIKYAKWRSAGNPPSVSAANMLQSMKIEELVDKKNVSRFRTLMDIQTD